MGQVARATITGIVRDGSGAVIAGVSVKARHVETGVFYDAATNEVGAYTIGALPIGEYSITYSSPGFKEFVRSGVTLASSQIARLDPVLELGGVQEKLTVTAEATLLETETSQASETVNSKVFTQLPLSFGGQGR